MACLRAVPHPRRAGHPPCSVADDVSAAGGAARRTPDGRGPWQRWRHIQRAVSLRANGGGTSLAQPPHCKSASVRRLASQMPKGRFACATTMPHGPAYGHQAQDAAQPSLQSCRRRNRSPGIVPYRLTWSAWNDADGSEGIYGFAVLIVGGPLNPRDALRLGPRWRQTNHLALDVEHIARSYRRHKIQILYAKPYKWMRTEGPHLNGEAHRYSGSVPSRRCEPFERG